MNILILSGSPRKSGNTDLLVEAFVKGASQKRHVEVVSVHDYKVNPCLGCNACFKSKDNTCVQKDDMAIIYEKMPVVCWFVASRIRAILRIPMP